MKRRLYIVAANQRYGDNAFLPLAAGLMWCYARQFTEITDVYEYCGTLYLKEAIEEAIGKFDSPDVVAFSSYIWNHEWNKQLATEIKKRWPACVTLVGGVQVQNESPAVLEECVAFDFAIYGEGEGAFVDWLRARACTGDSVSSIGSLIWRNGSHVRVNTRRAEVDIETIPSPYLEGFFDDIIASRPDLKFQALQETNRGCPYSCTFCAWGDASLTKLRKFSFDRVTAEFEWMAQHKIEFLYNADANWGILPRDVELTKSLVGYRERTGYPQKFRAAFAKNSNDVVFEISKTLSDAGMLKATTLALQSMKDGTLQLIKRKNIKYERLAELSKRYEDAGISTYAEIIVGLPGETYTSFVEGVDALLEAGQHDGISIYLCMLLNNTEMATAAYRKAHGIESVPMKALMYHGTPEPGVVEEIQETVVGTATMPRESLELAVLFGWFVQALHSFGLTQHIAKKLRDDKIRYSAFYGELLEGALADDSLLGYEIAFAQTWWVAARAGHTWSTVDERFGSIMWPPEELLFLRLACRSDLFYDEMSRMTCFGDISALVDEQRALFVPPEPGHEEEYAREAVWYGRKGPGRKLRVRG